MTVYARSDVAAVNISTTHGGCGDTHSRPAPGGIPAKLWALTCHNGCEDVLRGDAHWAGTPHTVPETPDELAIRQDSEKRGQVEQQTSMATALNDLAKLGALPDVLAQLLGHLGQSTSSSTTAVMSDPNLICRNGHVNRSDTKFCGECGADVQDAVNKQPVAALSVFETASIAEDDVPVTSGEDPDEPVISDLDGLTHAQLKEIAKERDLEIAPSKVRQLDIIKKSMTQ